MLAICLFLRHNTRVARREFRSVAEYRGLDLVWEFLFRPTRLFFAPPCERGKRNSRKSKNVNAAASHPSTRSCLSGCTHILLRLRPRPAFVILLCANALRFCGDTGVVASELGCGLGVFALQIGVVQRSVQQPGSWLLARAAQAAFFVDERL